jgi:hypothetical protein
MSKRAEIFIMSMKNSPRLVILKKKLKEIGIDQFKVFYGNDGSTKKKRSIVYSLYDKKKVKYNLGREMTFNEIGAEYTTIRIYKYILKHKVKNAIIMFDDVYPSFEFQKWLNSKIFLKGPKIISFFCAPPGFLEKKPLKILTNLNISLHLATTHLFAGWCFQVNIAFCRRYLKVTNGKICGASDFPFNFKKAGISIFLTLPYLLFPNDRGVSYLRKERNRIDKSIIPLNIKEEIKKFNILNNILIFCRIIWYVSFIGYFFKKCSLTYYKEYFFSKYVTYLINFISSNYISINKIYNKLETYPPDLKKFIKHLKV